jgi:hypothetical protein
VTEADAGRRRWAKPPARDETGFEQGRVGRFSYLGRGGGGGVSLGAGREASVGAGVGRGASGLRADRQSSKVS